MSDLEQRTLDREAALGDLGAQVRGLHFWTWKGSELEVGCGSCGGIGERSQDQGHNAPRACEPCNGTGRITWPWRGDAGRLLLAAYCRNEAARVLVGKDPEWPADSLPLDIWMNYMAEHWPREALVRAARAAAGAWAESRHVVSNVDPEFAALRAVDAWLADPTDANLDACGRVGTTQDPARLLAFYVGETFSQWAVPTWTHVIAEAVRLASEIKVREGIQRALIAWALGKES